MKNRLTVLALCGCISLFASCAGNQPPQQGNDTVSKADATKDTLNVDTNTKTDRANTIKPPTDTLKMKMASPKK